MLTERDFEQAARDPKYMAARWEQRVVMSQRELKKSLSNPSLNEKERKIELLLHRNRLKKALEMKKKIKR